MMYSAGFAFAYALWTRHRIVMSFVLGYLVVLVFVVNVLPVGSYDRRLIPPLTIPLWFAVPFMLLVFCQEDKPDFFTRTSSYPRRLFIVPLRPIALAGWPLLLGGATLTLFWLAISGLILRPTGILTPLLWPAVFLVAVLAWLQALSWWHFPVPVLRNFLRLAVAMSMVLGLVFVGSFCGLFAGTVEGTPQFKAFSDTVAELFAEPPALWLPAAAASIPLGCLISAVGIARVRRGDVPIWDLLAFVRSGVAPARPLQPYKSAVQAMFWFQWARHGKTLPLMASPGLILAMAILLLLFFAFRTVLVSSPQMVSELIAVIPRALVGVAVYTLFMAHGAGALLGSDRPWSRRVRGMQPFIAARPISTIELIVIKFKVAAISAVCTWVLAFLAVYATTLPLLGHVSARQFLSEMTPDWCEGSPIKTAAVWLLVLVGLPLLTWKECVNQLWVGMRKQSLTSLLLHLSPLLAYVALAGLIVVAGKYAGPWLLLVPVVFKLIAGALVVKELRTKGFVKDRTLRRLGFAWVFAAACIYTLAFWLTPANADPLLPWIFANIGILMLPLVRVGLAPLLMEEWRHQ